METVEKAEQKRKNINFAGRRRLKRCQYKCTPPNTSYGTWLPDIAMCFSFDGEVRTAQNFGKLLDLINQVEKKTY